MLDHLSGHRVRIAVLGASGLIGAPVADLLEQAGHEVRRLHRSSPSFSVDVLTGRGLDAALDGVEVVVNALNQPPSRRAAPVLTEGTRRVLAATDAHHVAVSIVGIEALAPRVAYYATKVAQEQLIINSGRPFSIVRATQFHEFLGAFALKLARARVELHSGARFAPVSAAEVAAVLSRTATRAPSSATVNVVGPETLTLTQLRAGRGLPLPVPLAGQLGAALKAGALTHPNPEIRGVLTYAQWLAEHAGRPWRPAPGARQAP